jgi:cephalosporin hydroxylase
LSAPISGDYDMIFIDGLHTYQQVYKELDLYSQYLNTSGWIILHDTNNPAHEGVRQAIEQFLKEPRNRWKYDRFDFFHCNGLTVLHKKEVLK